MLPEKSNCDSIKTLCDKSPHSVWVCVPTPMNKDGSCDTSIVENVIEEINNSNYTGVVVIKSTVIVGTTNKLIVRYPDLNIVFNPEFLTEANAVYDFLSANCIYLGGFTENCNKIKKLYGYIYDNTVSYHISENPDLTEMVKYTANTFLSVKVGFFNEIHEFCEKQGIDYKHLIEGMLYDVRIGMTHMKVPGPDGKKGFGGHCFPKDLNALIHKLGETDVDTTILSSVWEKNKTLRDDL